MYLSILRPSRRDMLKMALSQFLATLPTEFANEAAERMIVEAAAEARQMLREVQASENLVNAHPTTHEIPEPK